MVSVGDQHAFCDLAKNYKFTECLEKIKDEPELANCQPAGRWPVLHQAAGSGNIGAVKELLAAKCDPTRKNRDGKLAHEVAKNGDLKILLENAASGVAVPDPTPGVASTSAKTGRFARGMSCEGTAAPEDFGLTTAEMHAFLDLAKNGKYSEAEVKLKEKPTPALQSQLVNCLPHPRKFRAIHQGSWWGHTKFVEILLRFQADPTLKDADGQTALDVATARKQQMEAKEELTNHGDVIKLLQEAEDKFGGGRLDIHSQSFERVEAAFVQTWDHSRGPPPVIKEIWNTKNTALGKAFDAYSEQLGKAGQKQGLEFANWWNDGYMPGNKQDCFYGCTTKDEAQQLARNGFSADACAKGLVLTASTEAVDVARDGKEQIHGVVLVVDVARGMVDAVDSGDAPGGPLKSGCHSRFFKDKKSTVVWKSEAVFPKYMMIFEDMPTESEMHSFLDLAKLADWSGVKAALEAKVSYLHLGRRGPRFYLANGRPEVRAYAALHQAAFAGDIEGVNILLTAKASPLAKSKEGKTVLDVVEEAGEGDKEGILKLLRSALPRRVPEGSDDFKRMVSDFEAKFDKNGTNFQRPIIKEIYDVESTHLMGYQRQYGEKIGVVKDARAPDARQPGNQQWRYHGTKMMCEFDGLPCGQVGCVICSIIENGFSMRWAAKGSFFGDGIYSTTSSSTSLRYAKNRTQLHWTENGSARCGAVFIANVVCGNVEYLKGSDYDPDACKKLPPGFHARQVAEAQTNEQYEILAAKFGAPMIPSQDECICFRDQSLCPKYLILFEKCPDYKTQNILLDKATEGKWDEVFSALKSAGEIDRMYLLDCFGGCSAAYNYLPRSQNLLLIAASQKRDNEVKQLLSLGADPVLKTRYPPQQDYKELLGM